MEVLKKQRNANMQSGSFWLKLKSPTTCNWLSLHESNCGIQIMAGLKKKKKKWRRWPRAVIYWNKSSQSSVNQLMWITKQSTTYSDSVFIYNHHYRKWLLLKTTADIFMVPNRECLVALNVLKCLNRTCFGFLKSYAGVATLELNQSCCLSSRCEVSQAPRCHHGSCQGHTEVKTPWRPSSIFRPVSCAKDAASTSSSSSFCVSLIWSILKNI